MMGTVPKSPEKSSQSPTRKADEVLPMSVKGGTKDAKDAHAGSDENGATVRSAPENVNGNTHVNVAFPFSKITVQEPSSELVDLTALVSDLLVALADWMPEERLAELRSRAEALSARLAT
jgi:hypothetical protein